MMSFSFSFFTEQLDASWSLVVAHQNAIGFGVCLFLWSWMFGASIFNRRPFINWFITDLILWEAMRWAEIPDLISTAWLVGALMLRAANFRKWSRSSRFQTVLLRFILARDFSRSEGSAQVQNANANFGKSFEDSFRELKIEFGLKCIYAVAIVFMLGCCGWCHRDVVFTDDHSDPIMWFYWGGALVFLVSCGVLYLKSWKLLGALAKAGASNAPDTNSGKLAKAMATSADLFIPRSLYPFLVVVACCYSPTAAYGIAGYFLFLSAFRPPEVKSEIHKVQERELWSRDAEAQVQLGHLNKSRVFLNLKTKADAFGPLILAWIFQIPAFLLWPQLKLSFLESFELFDFMNADSKSSVVCAAWTSGGEFKVNRELMEKTAGVSFAWLYHLAYLDERQTTGLIESTKIIESSDAVIFVFGEHWCTADSLEAIKAGLSRPFRQIDVIQIRDNVNLLLLKNMPSEIARYTFKVMDEPTFDAAQMQLADFIDGPLLEFNERTKTWLEDHGVKDWGSLYSSGITELNLLHRRVHEIPIPATRFMELLNIWELVARWTLVEQGCPELDAHPEEFSLPFGKVVSMTRTHPLMQSQANLPDALMKSARAIWKEAFGWTQKMSGKPKVLDQFSWMVFIRNKTRGHGSPSRVSFELYATLEGLTVELLKLANEHLDLECLVIDKNAPFGVGSLRRGMTVGLLDENGVFDPQQAKDNIDDKGEKESVLLRDLRDGNKTIEGEGFSHVTWEENTVYLRQYASGKPWRTSPLLRAENGHIYLLNDVRKGHKEWVCFSTGDMIRPNRIFDA